MTGSHAPKSATGQAKEDAAFYSIFASAGLAIAKLFAAIWSGSLGLLSEAIHSLLDTGATIMTYLAVRVSDKPADDVHHYGHTKVESIAALAETGLLFVASGWIVWEAGHRLWTGDFGVEVHWIAVAVVVVSIGVDYFRARALNKVAKETRSQALEADALHFSSDMWSSLVVLAGLGFVAVGFPQGDAIAALVVACFVTLAAWRLGKRTVDTLLDAAPQGVGASVTELIEPIRGVASVDRVRVRPAGSVLFVDVDLAVARTRAVTDVAATKAEVIDRIRAAMPEAEVSVTTRPIALDDETVHDRIMVIARNHALAVHHLTVQTIERPNAEPILAISLDLEVDGRMPLEEAHRIATRLEEAIGEEFGAAEIEVETHIEPLILHGLHGIDLGDAEAERVTALLARAAAGTPAVTDIHSVRARRTDQGVMINFHCRVPPDMTVEAMHDAIDEVERAVRSERPDIRRAIGHAEPLGVPHAERRFVRAIR